MLISDFKKNFDKKLSSLSGKVTKDEVFADFLDVAAIALCNAPVSQGVLSQDEHYREREERYLDYVLKYKREGMTTFAQMLGIVQAALACERNDFLGTFFQESGLKGAHLKSVELTPYALAKVMAVMTVGDEASLRQKIEEKGYVSLDEPACGAGIMPIAVSEVMEEMGFNPTCHLLVRATDINRLMFCITYIQLSCYGIPAVVRHGDTLRQEIWESWETPRLQVIRRSKEVNPMVRLLALMAQLEGERSVGEAVSGAGEMSETTALPPVLDEREEVRREESSPSEETPEPSQQPEKPLNEGASRGSRLEEFSPPEQPSESSQQLELFDWTGKLESD